MKSNTKRHDTSDKFTTPANTKVLHGAKLAIAVLCGIIGVLSLFGLGTNTYGIAQMFLSFATYPAWGICLLVGFLFAYRIEHPRVVKPRSPFRFILTGLGFIFGLIPGLILATILTYPLSKHACELSGSKYC